MEKRNLPARGMRTMIFWLVVAIVMILDQTTKLAVRSLMEVGESRTLVPGLFDLLYVRNDGAAFSMGQGAGVLFVIIALAVLVGAFVLIWREELPLSLVISISCVAGGGVGNMIDRLAGGSVTDFIATTFIDFPVFNVADIFVTCGVIASLVGYYVWEARSASHEAPAPSHGR